MDEIMEDALGDLQGVGVELANDKRLCDLDYAENLMCLFESMGGVACTRQTPEGCSSIWDVLCTFSVNCCDDTVLQ